MIIFAYRFFHSINYFTSDCVSRSMWLSSTANFVACSGMCCLQLHCLWELLRSWDRDSILYRVLCNQKRAGLSAGLRYTWSCCIANSIVKAEWLSARDWRGKEFTIPCKRGWVHLRIPNPLSAPDSCVFKIPFCLRCQVFLLCFPPALLQQIQGSLFLSPILLCISLTA